MCGKCGCSYKLCPCSFGLAVGLTCGLGMFFGALIVMYFGVAPAMAMFQYAVPGFREAAILSLIALLKGFVFGFFVVLFYNGIVSCCMKKGCCKKDACCDKSDASCSSEPKKF